MTLNSQLSLKASSFRSLFFIWCGFSFVEDILSHSQAPSVDDIGQLRARLRSLLSFSLIADDYKLMEPFHEFFISFPIKGRTVSVGVDLISERTPEKRTLNFPWFSPLHKAAQRIFVRFHSPQGTIRSSHLNLPRRSVRRRENCEVCKLWQTKSNDKVKNGFSNNNSFAIRFESINDAIKAFAS